MVYEGGLPFWVVVVELIIIIIITARL